MANYQAMTNKELINLCKERGLSTSGPKAVLIARLSQGVKSEAEVVAEAVKEVAENRTSEYAINAMRPALIAAHKLNNKKAITPEYATMAGVSEDKYKEWLGKVEALRQSVAKFNELRQSQSSKDKTEELEIAKNSVFATWRKCVECGDDGNKFHKKWFINPEYDIYSLAGYDETKYETKNGAQMGHATPTAFRKMVEFLIGWRITGNLILSDEDRDDLLEYEKAKKGIATCDKKLNGYGEGEKHVKGLIEKIVDLENHIKFGEEMFRSQGQDDNEIAENMFLMPSRVQLKALKSEKESAEKTKAAHEETVRKLEDRANAIYAKLNPPKEE